MIRDQAYEQQRRISLKTLDHQFRKELEAGLNCSPIESGAIVELVKEVYFPYSDGSESFRPGKVVAMAVDIKEPPGRALKDCTFKRIFLTLFAASDPEYRRRNGVAALRRRQIRRMAQEAREQGALLSVEDLAYTLLNVSKSTICRDLKALRQAQVTVPLRGQQKDLGRGITHRLQIVKDFMDRHTFVQIQRARHHSLESIKTYLATFVRVGCLTEQGYALQEIAFMVKISPYLAGEYQKLYQSYRETEEYRDRLQEVTARFTPQEKGEKGALQ